MTRVIRNPKMSDIQPGDYVRVARAEYHHVQFGALVRVRQLSKLDDDLLVYGPCKCVDALKDGVVHRWNDEQYIELRDVLQVVKEK